MSYGICSSAITLAGYLLGATRRITVGTAASVLSTQHPVALAEQAALLNQVSGGRFRLGIGRGGPLLAALNRPRLACGPNLRFPDIDIVPRPRHARQ
jgi:alkanesulfonate monooxygenase SsuD/methylene tetrahydromethanopterin reductase-like flavin-dependent oxidoreductase (luciferase family)